MKIYTLQMVYNLDVPYLEKAFKKRFRILIGVKFSNKTGKRIFFMNKICTIYHDHHFIQSLFLEIF